MAAGVALLGGAGAMVVDLPALASPTTPATKTTARTLRTTTTLNVRTGPATSYRVITVLTKGTVVTATGPSSHGFTQIRLAGTTRWVATQYLVPTGKPAAKPPASKPAPKPPAAKPPASKPSTATSVRIVKVATTALDIRSVPTLPYQRWGEIPKGAKVTVTGVVRNGRAQIVWGKGTAWVTAAYLIPAPAAKPAAPKPTTPKPAAPKPAPAKPAAPKPAPATPVAPAPVPSKPVTAPPPPVKPAPAPQPLPTITGTRYATTELIIRSTSGADFQDLGTVPTGTALSITGVTQNGRAQIIYNGAVRWVTGQYLSASKPLPTITGTRYATTELIIRSTAGADFQDLGTVPTGTALSITGVTQNGRAQIIYNGAVRWVTAQYLATTKPLVGGAGGAGGTSATRGPAGIVSYAQQYLGTPYSWGGGSLTGTSVGFGSGAGINGFDCSGLVRAAVYSASGGSVVLPRTTWDQVNQGTVVDNNARRPGDLIFFQTDGFSWSHVGIYIGGGKMIDAPRPGAFVRVDDLTSGYYLTIKQTTRRIL